MPCRSDYMDPNGKEIALQRTAKLLVYLNKKLGLPSSKTLIAESENCYCASDFVPKLCKLLSGLTPEQENLLVYNGRVKEARDLADWWDEHKAADAKRIAKEKRDAEDKELAQRALQKISKEELAALKKWLLK